MVMDVSLRAQSNHGPLVFDMFQQLGIFVTYVNAAGPETRAFPRRG